MRESQWAVTSPLKYRFLQPGAHCVMIQHREFPTPPPMMTLIERYSAHCKAWCKLSLLNSVYNSLMCRAELSQIVEAQVTLRIITHLTSDHLSTGLITSYLQEIIKYSMWSWNPEVEHLAGRMQCKCMACPQTPAPGFTIRHSWSHDMCDNSAFLVAQVRHSEIMTQMTAGLTKSTFGDPRSLLGNEDYKL